MHENPLVFLRENAFSRATSEVNSEIRQMCGPCADCAELVDPCDYVINLFVQVRPNVHCRAPVWLRIRRTDGFVSASRRRVFHVVFENAFVSPHDAIAFPVRPGLFGYGTTRSTAMDRKQSVCRHTENTI